MKIINLDPSCQDCFAAVVTRIAAMHKLSDERIATLVAETRALVTTAPADYGPPQVARQLGPLLRKHLGVEDPFREVKEKGNRQAAAAIDELRRRVEGASDPFQAALRIALAGNVIDFAYAGRQDLLATVETLADAPLGIDETELLRADLARAETVLYLGDNTGEVWCDRLLIETFPTTVNVTFATREVPVLNDATLVEAREAGLHEVAELISSGSDAPGAILSLLNERTRRLLDTADVVISKGQGNFEALFGHAPRPVYFLFLVKCGHVADIIEREVGSGIVWQWRPCE